MGLFDSITGSIFGSGPEQVSAPSIQAKSILTGQQKKALDEFLLPFLTSTGLEGLRDSPSPLGTAGASDLGKSSLAALEQIVAGGQAGKTAGVGRNALFDIIGRGETDIEDFFQTNILDPSLKDFQEKILPGIGRDFGGTSFFSSERQKADALAREDLTEGLVKSRSDVALRGREQDTNAILAAVQQLGGIESIEPSVMAGILGAGEIVRGQEEGLLQATREEDLRQKSERDKRISQLLQAIGLPATENIAFPATIAQGQEGIGGQAALLGLEAFLGG